jgi:hypothetical protein
MRFRALFFQLIWLWILTIQLTEIKQNVDDQKNVEYPADDEAVGCSQFANVNKVLLPLSVNEKKHFRLFSQ